MRSLLFVINFYAPVPLLWVAAIQKVEGAMQMLYLEVTRLAYTGRWKMLLFAVKHLLPTSAFVKGAVLLGSLPSAAVPVRCGVTAKPGAFVLGTNMPMNIPFKTLS